MGDVGEAIASDVKIGVRAEGAIDKIISKVHPTASSEQRRRDVIYYIQRLVKRNLGCEVFPYGSVPLKTYLPDGDIDLTAFVDPGLEEALANDVVSVLQSEERNDVAEFIVKDVQLIRAEVKIVKCIVQSIVVDISFNQLGGLCTLCFLEQVDRRIGKDHLFKRSIILIKSWCYYESRILGAHHALISTYALETLVLYIFHLFQSEVNGPLAVLYKFLDYFSKFDWDHYCISLNGPVRLSSSPEIEEMKIGIGERDLVLTEDFLRECENMFSVPPRVFEKNIGVFTPKHLNIIDPLKSNNNLGRSVSKGNLFRIRSAFAYGARKLGRAVSQTEEKITEEVHKFFSNTLDRHGSGLRPDVQDVGGGYFHHGFPFSETESCKSVSPAYSVSVSTNRGRECDIGDDDDASSVTQQTGGDYHGHSLPDHHGLSSNDFERCVFREVDRLLVIGGPPNNNMETLVTSDLRHLKISNESPRSSKASPLSAPHHYFPGSNSSEKSSTCDPNELSLPDLRGDYDTHFNSLRYGRLCYEHSLALQPVLAPPVPPQWDAVRYGYPHKRNGFVNGQLNNVGMMPRPIFHPNNGMMLRPPPRMPTFAMDDLQKHHGTGTFIPDSNRPPYRNHTMGRGRMSEHGPMLRPPHRSPRQPSYPHFRKVDSFIANNFDVTPPQLRLDDEETFVVNDVLVAAERRTTVGSGVNEVPPVVTERRTAAGSGVNEVPPVVTERRTAVGSGVNEVPPVVTERRTAAGSGVNEVPPVVAERRIAAGSRGNDVSHTSAEKSKSVVTEKSKSVVTAQPKILSGLIPSPPPPPVSPVSTPEVLLQSSSPVLPAASSNNLRLVRAESYHLKDEEDFPPLSM